MTREAVEFVEISGSQFGEKKKIKLFQGGNGDFYLTVCPHNHNGGDTVRIETSGGASTRNPRLVQAINLLYLAMAEKFEDFDSIMERKKTTKDALSIEELIETYEEIKLVSNSSTEAEKLKKAFFKNFKNEYQVVEKEA